MITIERDKFSYLGLFDVSNLRRCQYGLHAAWNLLGVYPYLCCNLDPSVQETKRWLSAWCFVSQHLPDIQIEHPPKDVMKNLSFKHQDRKFVYSVATELETLEINEYSLEGLWWVINLPHSVDWVLPVAEETLPSGPYFVTMRIWHTIWPLVFVINVAFEFLFSLRCHVNIRFTKAGHKDWS